MEIKIADTKGDGPCPPGGRKENSLLLEVPGTLLDCTGLVGQSFLSVVAA